MISAICQRGTEAVMPTIWLRKPNLPLYKEKNINRLCFLQTPTVAIKREVVKASNIKACEQTPLTTFSPGREFGFRNLRLSSSKRPSQSTQSKVEEESTAAVGTVSAIWLLELIMNPSRDIRPFGPVLAADEGRGYRMDGREGTRRGAYLGSEIKLAIAGPKSARTAVVQQGLCSSRERKRESASNSRSRRYTVGRSSPSPRCHGCVGLARSYVGLRNSLAESSKLLSKLD